MYILLVLLTLPVLNIFLHMLLNVIYIIANK